MALPTFSGNVGDFLGRNLSTGDLANLNRYTGNSPMTQSSFQANGNIYQVKDNGNNTFSLQQTDTLANQQQQQAQQQFQQQQGSAINTLQTGKANLGQQYSDLLKTVTGEYQPLINQTTAGANAEMARRGLTPDSFLAQQQVQGALQPVYGAEAANAQQLGAGSIADTNAYNTAISQAQQSGAQFGAQLPLQYGNLALQQQALPSQIALTTAQAGAQAPYSEALKNALQQAQIANQYYSIQPGVTFFNAGANTYFNPSTGQYGKI